MRDKGEIQWQYTKAETRIKKNFLALSSVCAHVVLLARPSLANNSILVIPPEQEKQGSASP